MHGSKACAWLLIDSAGSTRKSFKGVKGAWRFCINDLLQPMPLKSRFLSDAVLSAKRQGQAMAFGIIIAIYPHLLHKSIFIC
jgi:hypothetical protein